MSAIYLDMDGTIADLYAVPNWLKMLRAENPTPYIQAEPLVRLSALARHLNRLQRNGYIIGIISWGSKHATPEYDEAVARAKNFWLNKHLPSVKFDEIHIVPYGTPKSTGAKEKNGYLFDDEENNRAEWGINAFDVVNMLDILGELE